MRQFAFGSEEQFKDIWDRLTIGSPRKIKFNVVIKPDTSGVLIFTTDENRRVVVSMETEGLAFDRYTGGSAFVKSLFKGDSTVFDSFDTFMEKFIGIRQDYEQEDESENQQSSTQSQPNRNQVDEGPRIKINSAAELSAMLKEKIIGQDAAIDGLAVSVYNHLRKVKPQRPLTIMLPGPTGVGKTATAKALAEVLQAAFGKDKMPFITINCNEYREEHRISQLIGSPAGYVGYKDACVLEPLKYTSSAIICFDEYEKANSNIHIAAMSWMDSGKIGFASAGSRDSDNSAEPRQEFDCSKSIIIMTTNIMMGANYSASMRFSICPETNLSESSISKNDRCRKTLVAGGFKPEVAGRISYFFEYHSLSEEDIKKILLLGFKNKATEYGIKVVDMSDELKNDIFTHYNHSDFGVRPLEYALDEILGSQVPIVETEETEYKASGTLEHLIFEEV